MRSKLSKQIEQKVRDSYAAIASEFDQTRKRPWEEFHHFLGYVRKGARALDIGCGNGRLYDVLKAKDVTYVGVDNSSQLLEKARANYPEARFELSDMVELNMEEGAFDNVFCVAAFHHLPDKKSRRKAAAQMYSVLKEDGVLVLTVWNLFQLKYIKNLLRAIGSFIAHLGFKYAWNDLWVKWGNHPAKRYYHAFVPSELRKYFPSDLWEVEEFYFTRKGNRVSFLRSFNIVIIVRKK